MQRCSRKRTLLVCIVQRLQLKVKTESEASAGAPRELAATVLGVGQQEEPVLDEGGGGAESGAVGSGGLPAAITQSILTIHFRCSTSYFWKNQQSSGFSLIFSSHAPNFCRHFTMSYRQSTANFFAPNFSTHSGRKFSFMSTQDMILTCALVFPGQYLMAQQWQSSLSTLESFSGTWKPCFQQNYLSLWIVLLKNSSELLNFSRLYPDAQKYSSLSAITGGEIRAQPIFQFLERVLHSFVRSHIGTQQCIRSISQMRERNCLMSSPTVDQILRPTPQSQCLKKSLLFQPQTLSSYQSRSSILDQRKERSLCYCRTLYMSCCTYISLQSVFSSSFTVQKAQSIMCRPQKSKSFCFRASQTSLDSCCGSRDGFLQVLARSELRSSSEKLLVYIWPGDSGQVFLE